MHILVADDDRAIRSLLERQLVKRGYEITLASDGNEAWTALQNDSIRVAVLDWDMPGINGVEICRRLQNLGRAVYTIILTGAEDAADVATALDAGASDYIIKPWIVDVLLARVNVGVRTIAMQSQLAQAQKLESIGQLAAGIAHEINTPIQYVGDNVRFLSDSIDDLLGLVESYRDLVSEIATGADNEDCVHRAAELESKADLPYLKDEAPKSIAQSLDGVGRVSTIVRAMKDFSHPGAEGKEAVDLNHAIESTITVARNEWKYVAELVTDFDSTLPPVSCLAGDFNQAILNIVVNAAHAIADAVGKDSGEKGTITITTRRDDGWAEVRISDTGTGIPEQHRSKVFDHFFTTKEVGKGTGQGLAIAHAVITEKHGGEVNFETETGRGTTFIIRLPIDPDVNAAEENPQHEEADPICR